jgi:lysine-N-methylase
LKWLQPRSYHAFRCIGADCEDTCCAGWAVNVDQRTYEAYQRCDDPELASSLHGLVVINTENASVENYAKITLSGSACPFLAEGLCSIQKKLGEEYLSIMCASYPRVIKQVNDIQQRSLDLSCPEAARVVLLDPTPIEFDETEFNEDDRARYDSRFGHVSVLRTAGASSDKPYQYFRESRSLVIWLLQNRNRPLWKRVAILASLCDQLHAVASTGQRTQTLDLLDACRDAVERGLFDEALNSHRAQPAAQLGVVLELIVDRIGSDFTAPRFFECYREFMAGVDWTTDSSTTDLGRRYAAAHSESYAPFMRQHEYILEHYLVSYVHRTLFPLGPQESNLNLGVSHSAVSIRDQCLLMLAHYGIVQAILIGVAGFHGTKFDVKHVIKVIQSSAKTFEHSLAFPPRALQILAKKGITNCASLAILLLN